MRRLVSPLDGIRSPFGPRIGAFSPATLFASGEQGVWYDPSDYSTMSQDIAGTTPVTAVEQPVGLLLDKSRGLVLGPELVSNGTFDADITGWTGTGGGAVSWADGKLRYVRSGSGQAAVLTMNTVAGKTYKLQFTAAYVAGDAAATIRVDLGSDIVVGAAVAGTTTAYVRPTSNQSNIRLLLTASATFDFDNISVREIAGNHASQATAASRPVLSARYNLLTYSEQFDNAAWAKFDVSVSANATTAPNGTLTADLVTESATTAAHVIRFASVTLSAVAHTYRINLKSNGRARVRFRTSVAGDVDVNLSLGTITADATGTAQITSAGDDWYLITFSLAQAAGATVFGFQIIFINDSGNTTYAGDGTSGIYIWGADLRVTNDGVGIPAYQRIAAATDYDTVGFPPYLRFDGTDDSMATAAIDFSATDEMSVFAGVRKLSDAAAGTLLELGTNANSTAQTFVLKAPLLSAAHYGTIFGGSIRVDTITPSDYAAPITGVVSALNKIATDSISLRVNGGSVAADARDQGTGNYANAVMYIGSRAGSSQRFNGRLYSLIVRGKTSTAAEITNTETWVNGKTGAF